MTVYRLINLGEILAVRVGRQLLVPDDGAPMSSTMNVGKGGAL